MKLYLNRASVFRICLRWVNVFITISSVISYKCCWMTDVLLIQMKDTIYEQLKDISGRRKRISLLFICNFIRKIGELIYWSSLSFVSKAKIIRWNRLWIILWLIRSEGKICIPNFNFLLSHPQQHIFFRLILSTYTESILLVKSILFIKIIKLFRWNWYFYCI